MALGCTAATPKHFRIIKRLSEYGFFNAGGVLIGTHAFVTFGNLLGIRFGDGTSTLDIDFAHAGRNISIALPADMHIDVHAALKSLEMGFLPIGQFDGQAGPQYRNPRDPTLRLDFVTSTTRSGKPIKLPQLNLTLQPLKFMDYLLKDTTQACLVSQLSACTVNIPSPERYAVHKLIVFAERPRTEQTKAAKDLWQALALTNYFVVTEQSSIFNAAWQDAMSRGKGWRDRLSKGKKALVKMAPDLNMPSLWA